MKKITFSFLFVLIGIVAYGQVTTSNIKGLILDEKSQPLPGANVVAIHTPTGTKYGAATNFDGRYNLLNLRVGGPYTVSVSYIGYKEQTLNDVYLILGKTKNLNAVMVADSEQLDAIVITGSGGTGIFGSSRTGAETNIGRRELTRLPSISRSAADFTRLEPTANGESFAGRNDQFNNFSLDGAIFNNPFGLDAPTPGGQTSAQPISLDAIDQITVSTAPYDVTQSGFTGASINAVTKSGTNEFYGTVYGFFRNQDYTGSKVKGESIFVPKLEQTQTGVSIGGSIVKDKLFFFANFEKDDREDLGQSWLPNTGTGAINESRVLRTDLDNVRAAFSAIGYDTGAYEGFIHKSASTKGIFKIDWNINDNNRLAVIYNFLNASKEKPAHPTAIARRGPNASVLQFENSGYKITNELKSIQIELNSTLSDNASNKFQFGYTHFNDFRNPFSTPAPSITITKAGAPYIVVGHEPFSVHNRLDQKVLQFTNNLNYVIGSHNYTIGFSFEKFQFDNSFNLTSYGFDVFGTVDINDFDATSYIDTIANAKAAFDANNAQPDGTPGGWTLAEVNVGQLSFYVQDEWDVSEEFKLTYGLRFDKPLFFDSSQKAQEVIDRGFVLADIPYFNPNTGESVLIDNTQLPSNDWLISPRIGFNYDVNGDDTLQFRGGSGLFTGRFPFVWLGNQIANPDVFFLQAVDPDYKFPQVWRTNLGIDKRLENGLILTADISYTLDTNSANVQNWGLNNPSGNLNAAGDNRLIYTAADRPKWGGPFDFSNAYIFTNSDENGNIWSASFKAQKTFNNGLFASVAYSYLDAKDVNSIEAEITSDAFAANAIVGDANKEVLSYSKYGNKHRIIGVASQKWTYGNDKWATTLSGFIEYARGGRFSYTYGGDLNNDGSSLNDLLYVPTSSQVGQMQFAAAGQGAAFEAFISQDDYLSGRRGQYAERYGALSPWKSRIDLKFLQDYNFKVVGNKTNTIQFSIDILNLGNLLNSNWGLVQVPNSIQPIGVAVTDGVPTYTFTGAQTKTFGYDSGLDSRWQMQFGLRYIF